LNEVRDEYESVRGKKLDVIKRGTVEDLEILTKEKKEHSAHWGDWLRYAFVLCCVKGTWMLERELLPGSKPSVPTTLREWLEAHPEV
jgi:hypothetical protein